MTFHVPSRWVGGLVLGLLATGGACRTASADEIDLRPLWDDRVALENPHKGWYHHYPDNHVDKYRIVQDADLLDFPGMDHLYLRLAWAYLEPVEGEYDWNVVDDVIRKWTAQGLGIAFRISCRETSVDRVEQQYATPKWVMEAGAKGGYYRGGQQVDAGGPWEPRFDDPIFLDKLERFLRAFAERYDGKPWLRYVDIGSIGDWGEGHTWAGSRTEYDYATRIRHINLHLKYFHRTQLVVTDDFVYALSDPEDRRRMHRYVADQGITYRDDSILVNGYLSGHSSRWTVRSPEFFEDVYRYRPTVLELEHYSGVKRLGNWDAKPDSSIVKYASGKTGSDFFLGALGLLHATYIGYHGDAREWRNDNPELTVELLNRCGYWYFLRRVRINESLRPGRLSSITLDWENRGVAPAYHPYHLAIRLEGPQTVAQAHDSGNLRWMPGGGNGKTYSETYPIAIPNEFLPGRFALKVKLYSGEEERPVFLALRSDLLDEARYYRVGEVEVAGNDLE